MGTLREELFRVGSVALVGVSQLAVRAGAVSCWPTLS